MTSGRYVKWFASGGQYRHAGSSVSAVIHTALKPVDF